MRAAKCRAGNSQKRLILFKRYRRTLLFGEIHWGCYPTGMKLNDGGIASSAMDRVDFNKLPCPG